jgi:DnaA-homolog protein
MQQLLLELLPPPAATFDNFIVGQNAATLNALRQWCADTRGSTCFLLWGEAGSGRRHLLAASGAQALPDAAAAAETAIAAAPPGSIFCKNDVDLLTPEGQVALFNAFNRLKLAGGKLLVASTQPPAALAEHGVREDLRTRLGSGLVYRLQALSDAEKRAALNERAEARGLKLPDEAIDYLFRHARRDMGTLSALIDALDRFTLQHQRPVTLPLLRTLLQSALELPA